MIRICLFFISVVGLVGCVESAPKPIPEKPYRLSWYGVAPFPADVQLDALDPQNTDFGGEGCVRDISSDTAKDLERLFQTGVPVRSYPDVRLSDMGPIVIVRSETEFAGIISASLVRDFEGRVYRINSFTDYPEIEFAAFSVLFVLGCSDVRDTVENGPDYAKPPAWALDQTQL